MAKKETKGNETTLIEECRNRNPPQVAIGLSASFKKLMAAQTKEKGEGYGTSMVLELLALAEYIRDVAAISNTAIDNPRLDALVASADKKYFKAKEPDDSVEADAQDSKASKKGKKGKKGKEGKKEKKPKGEKTKVPWEDDKA